MVGTHSLAVMALQEEMPRRWAFPTLPPSIGIPGDVGGWKSSEHEVNTSVPHFSEKSKYYMLFTTQLEKGAMRKRKRDEGRSV